MSASSETLYDVFCPEGIPVDIQLPDNELPSDLNQAVVGLLWDYMFRGDDIFSYIKDALTERHPGIRFIDYQVFGDLHGKQQEELAAAIPDRLREHGANAAISGIAACGSCTAAVIRAHVSAEAGGYPAVSIITSGFIPQAKMVAGALGVKELRHVEFPSVPMTESPESLRAKVEQYLVDPIEAALNGSLTAAVA